MKNSTAGLLASMWLVGCITPRLITPEPQDAPAPSDTLAQVRGVGGHSRCAREVQVLSPALGAIRPFRAIASISATCSPGTPSVCEEHLRERACELEGDAVILSDKGYEPAPSTGATRSLVARAGRVVRWLDGAAEPPPGAH